MKMLLDKEVFLDSRIVIQSAEDKACVDFIGEAIIAQLQARMSSKHPMYKTVVNDVITVLDEEGGILIEDVPQDVYDSEYIEERNKYLQEYTV